jgi:hypothetical protein
MIGSLARMELVLNEAILRELMIGFPEFKDPNPWDRL